MLIQITPFITQTYQEEETITKKTPFIEGYNGKLSFNAATSYKDKLYIGINLNSHLLQKTKQFYEDNNPLTPDYTISKLRFDNDLYTYGTGFSFQVGAAKVTNEMRVGLAYESSTWYNLMMNYLKTSFCKAAATDDINDVSDPRLTNFTHRTSYKHQVNLQEVCLCFGKGLISLTMIKRL
jgi:hypothetical protein